MKKLLSLLTVLSLSAWMIGCAPEETTPPAAPATDTTPDTVDGDVDGTTPESTDDAGTEAAPEAGDTPPADGEPEGGSTN